MHIMLCLGGVKICLDCEKEIQIEDVFLPFIIRERSGISGQDEKWKETDILAAVSWKWVKPPLRSAVKLGEDLIQTYYRREEKNYCIVWEGEKGAISCVEYDDTFSHVSCRIQERLLPVAPKSLGEILRYFPMRAILQQFLVLFFHAAQITYQETGILFAGPSGAGKTTQAKLWERFRNARIICNDRTLLRKQDGNWHSYGYPMDGSQPVRSGEVHVAGCIVLVKQSQNGKSSIERLRAGKAMAQLMPQLVIDWWSEDAAKCGLLFPLLTGGEPFLYEDFQEVFAGMQDLGMQVSINSNASRIDQNMARWLGRHTPTRINITLYGASEETYQKLCGNGESFLKVKNAVRWLKQYGVPIKLNASITPQNVQDLESMISYAKECQIPIQAATYMFPPIRRNAVMVGQNERLSPEEAALARVKTDFLTGEGDWFWRQAERFGRFQKGEERFRENSDEEKRCEDKKMTDENVMTMHCRAGHCSFWVDWQGNLVNCGMYASAKTSLKERSFAEAWKELVAQTEKVCCSPACIHCANKKICHPCIAMIAAECGEEKGCPEYLCRMHAAEAEVYQAVLEKWKSGCGNAEVFPVLF